MAVIVPELVAWSAKNLSNLSSLIHAQYGLTQRMVQSVGETVEPARSCKHLARLSQKCRISFAQSTMSKDATCDSGLLRPLSVLDLRRNSMALVTAPFVQRCRLSTPTSLMRTPELSDVPRKACKQWQERVQCHWRFPRTYAVCWR